MLMAEFFPLKNNLNIVVYDICNKRLHDDFQFKTFQQKLLPSQVQMLQKMHMSAIEKYRSFIYLLNLMCLFFPDLLYIITVSSVSVQCFVTFKQRN